MPSTPNRLPKRFLQKPNGLIQNNRSGLSRDKGGTICFGGRNCDKLSGMRPGSPKGTVPGTSGMDWSRSREQIQLGGAVTVGEGCGSADDAGGRWLGLGVGKAFDAVMEVSVAGGAGEAGGVSVSVEAGAAGEIGVGASGGGKSGSSFRI